MGQMLQTSPAGLEEHGWESSQEQFLGQMECVEPGMKPMERGESTPAKLRGLAWCGFKLCNSFVHRWFNLYDFDALEALYALGLVRCFAGVDLGSVDPSCETVASGSCHLSEEDGFMKPDSSSAMPGSQSKFEISWRTPWLYLCFLLLFWLLLF
jgi:hypothetical protein